MEKTRQQQLDERQEQKDRMKELGYKWIACKYCGQTTRFRGENPPTACGAEDCQRKLMRERIEMKKSV